MRTRRVVYRRAAGQDLLRIGHWLASQASSNFSKAYIRRIRQRIDTLSYGSERGTIRTEAGAGVRVIGIMGSISVAFVVTEERVVILRVLHGGQDWQDFLTADSEFD